MGIRNLLQIGMYYPPRCPGCGKYIEEPRPWKEIRRLQRTGRLRLLPEKCPSCGCEIDHPDIEPFL